MFRVRLIHRRYAFIAALKADVSLASKVMIRLPSSSSTVVLERLPGDFLASGLREFNIVFRYLLE